jgi:hypothetical protein
VAAARSGARRWLRREEGDDLPGGPAGPSDRTEAGWRRGPSRPVGRWAEWAGSEGKFFSE